MERKRNGLFRFVLHLRMKVLQLQLANATSGFVLRRLSAFPQQNQQNIMVARALCVMYYGQSCARNGNKAKCCTEIARKLLVHCTNYSCKLFNYLYCTCVFICVRDHLCSLLGYGLYRWILNMRPVSSRSFDNNDNYDK